MFVALGDNGCGSEKSPARARFQGMETSSTTIAHVRKLSTTVAHKQKHHEQKKQPNCAIAPVFSICAAPLMHHHNPTQTIHHPLSRPTHLS